LNVKGNESQQKQLLLMAVETEFTVIPQVEKPFVTPNGKFSQCNIQGAIV
jgi:hypothetical protein